MHSAAMHFNAHSAALWGSAFVRAASGRTPDSSGTRARQSLFTHIKRTPHEGRSLVFRASAVHVATHRRMPFETKYLSYLLTAIGILISRNESDNAFRTPSAR
ncbi:hypothetical protein FKP32DRAFT_217068 [Trametes sanguinea]|nr:hypothetical protein FKP32DRAFT_217068 [Trametes sanguinea]